MLVQTTGVAIPSREYAVHYYNRLGQKVGVASCWCWRGDRALRTRSATAWRISSTRPGRADHQPKQIPQFEQLLWRHQALLDSLVQLFREENQRTALPAWRSVDALPRRFPKPPHHQAHQHRIDER